ncbi:hypothetical protein DNU06_01035 [Putridiphycobacter roseus]|uniref:Uncharacterized protein n=1 Tax=Putridiphycobacter roseus TaxID=2219161 RepID=A0A2W1N1F3_9FLAO|nr:hypothetical protein [Putridiphycobacter roseus]PZE18449.1 hypothetical protein DNU06_01035 [Putridiphycobacter roseus]
MKWGWYLYGFGLGTIKYLPAQWLLVMSLNSSDTKLNFIEIFLSTYIGALVCMTVFYFGSEFFIERSLKKNKLKEAEALSKNLPFEAKRKFTRINKLIVKVRRSLGIYAFTFLAPLFLSIPLGSIACAKFYGHYKKTFVLMVLFMGIYGFVMTLAMMMIYE